MDLTVVEPRDTSAATADVEVAASEVGLTVVGGGGTTTELLDGTNTIDTAEEVGFELGGGEGAAEEPGGRTGAKETVDVLILGGGSTTDKLRKDTVAVVAIISVEPRITVPISLFSGTG
jgi:hypothetical protein